MKVSKHQAGMTFGTVGALYTLIWSIVVGLGLGEWTAVTKTHLLFLNNPFTVSSFSFTNMIVLVVGTFIGAYIFGWIFAWVWDWYQD